MRIEYIGRKPVKQDNVAGTGIWWNGQGDVQDVPDGAAPTLLKYDAVWRQVADAAPQPATKTEPVEPVNAEPKFVLQGPEGDLVLDTMDDAALAEWVKTNLEPHGIKVDMRAKGDKRRQAIVDAVKTAAEQE